MTDDLNDIVFVKMGIPKLGMLGKMLTKEDDQEVPMLHATQGIRPTRDAALVNQEPNNDDQHHQLMGRQAITNRSCQSLYTWVPCGPFMGYLSTGWGKSRA
jgi:hypothetical protein